MWMDGWTDSHPKPTTRSSKMCELPYIGHSVIYVKSLHGTDFRLLDSKQQNFRIT
jgi:hypothetical protein